MIRDRFQQAIKDLNPRNRKCPSCGKFCRALPVTLNETFDINGLSRTLKYELLCRNCAMICDGQEFWLDGHFLGNIS